MKTKTISGIMLTLLLTGMLTLAFNIQPAKAVWEGPRIVIYADGSYSPSDAPISVDGNVYTLTNDVEVFDQMYAIRVRCSNIVLEGDGHTIQPKGHVEHGVLFTSVDNVIIRNFVIDGLLYFFGDGIYVTESSDVTVSGNTITNVIHGVAVSFSCNTIVSGNTISNDISGRKLGIWLLGSSNYNSISGNTIINNWAGISIVESSHNTVSENNIESNDMGVSFYNASGNTFLHNNFAGNTEQVYDVSWDHPHIPPSVNTWDNGAEGNYWSDYTTRYPDAQELDGSGIWDTPYVIDENNQDNYPLMEPWTPQEALEDLIQTVESWDLNTGTENSLTSKLDDAIHLLNQGNENGAIHKLMDFIDQVEASRGKKLNNEQADQLISEAQRIIDLIEG